MCCEPISFLLLPHKVRTMTLVPLLWGHGGLGELACLTWVVPDSITSTVRCNIPGCPKERQRNYSFNSDLMMMERCILTRKCETGGERKMCVLDARRHGQWYKNDDLQAEFCSWSYSLIPVKTNTEVPGLTLGMGPGQGRF